jgi:hypothetical protein
LFSGCPAVQGADGVGGIVDLSQGVEIPAIGGEGDIRITKQAGHALQHVDPLDDFLALAPIAFQASSQDSNTKAFQLIADTN